MDSYSATLWPNRSAGCTEALWRQLRLANATRAESEASAGEPRLQAERGAEAAERSRKGAVHLFGRDASEIKVTLNGALH